ncbi:MAG: MmgE/PrpD family protein [Rhizobiaceae bacterium]
MTDPASAPVTQRLGAFVAGHRRSAVPGPLRREARRALVNFLGCAIGVAGDPAIEALTRVLSDLSGRRDATVLGRRERLDAGGAAFVNAAAANFLDFDDTHLPTVIHPTAPVAAAVLALGEARGSAGADVLHAFLLGAEVACRLGLMVSPGHYARGWHITATCGVLGAAAACARLLGHDADRSANAIGVASGLSAGLVENLSWPAKNVGVGNAARGGVLAALLAGEGYTAAPTAIEGPLGWARAMGDVPAIDDALAGLGKTWSFARNTYKPYPAGIVMHAVIDACLELRRVHWLRPDKISRVTVAGDALLMARGDRVVRNERDARVSIHHAAAAAFVAGAADLSEFAAPAVSDPAMAAFRRKVTASLDETLAPGAATVTVETQAGGVFSHTVTQARGSEALPMSDDEIEAKASLLIGRSGTGIEAEALFRLVHALDGAPDLSALMRAAASSSRESAGDPHTTERTAS